MISAFPPWATRKDRQVQAIEFPYAGLVFCVATENTVLTRGRSETLDHFLWGVVCSIDEFGPALRTVLVTGVRRSLYLSEVYWYRRDQTSNKVYPVENLMAKVRLEQTVDARQKELDAEAKRLNSTPEKAPSLIVEPAIFRLEHQVYGHAMLALAGETIIDHRNGHLRTSRLVAWKIRSNGDLTLTIRLDENGAIEMIDPDYVFWRTSPADGVLRPNSLDRVRELVQAQSPPLS